MQFELRYDIWYAGVGTYADTILPQAEVPAIQMVRDALVALSHHGNQFQHPGNGGRVVIHSHMWGCRLQTFGGRGFRPLQQFRWELFETYGEAKDCLIGYGVPKSMIPALPGGSSYLYARGIEMEHPTINRT